MILENIRPLPPRNRSELLYHKDIGFPEDINLPAGFDPVMTLRYSNHAQQEAQKDIYGDIKLPPRVDVRRGQTIEIAVSGTLVTKMVIRFPYDDTRDITMVIQPEDGFVRTVWLNDKTDQHTSLNRAKYADPKRPDYRPQQTNRPTKTQQEYHQSRMRQPEEQRIRH